jgi:two-component system, LuxR family, response regulator FixJ
MAGPSPRVMAEPIATGTVHVIDDDDAIRDSLRLLLEVAGLSRVKTYASALAFFDEAGIEPGDCLIVDVRMPGIDGIELLRRLGDRGTRIPVIVMTGHGDIATAVRALKAGARDFLEKPFDHEVVIEMVRDAMATAAHARREVAEIAETTTRHNSLTDRERDVLQAMIAGHPNKVIAHLLGISPRTVEIHRARVMEKTQARSLSELVRRTLAAGLAKSG